MLVKKCLLAGLMAATAIAAAIPTAYELSSSHLSDKRSELSNPYLRPVNNELFNAHVSDKRNELKNSHLGDRLCVPSNL
ncbi:MAG: hypothetical protein Q9170_005109 [Blastenia crenularia]